MILLILLLFQSIFQKCIVQAMTESQLKDFLENDYEKAASENRTNMLNTKWDHLTDENNHTKEQIFEDTLKAHKAFKKEYWEKYFKNLNPDKYQDEKIKRQLNILRNLEEMRVADEAAGQNKDDDEIHQANLWSYESADIFKDIDDVWKEVEPFFMELRKYIGRKLKEKFGEMKGSVNENDRPFFGYTQTESIENITKALRPFPEAKMVDLNLVTAAMKEQQLDVLKMFYSANAFFTSMGLKLTEMAFDVSKGAIIEKPSNIQMECEASAWDFCDRSTYRIKMCAEVNAEDYLTILHELGHIQYFVQYAKQPYIFRTGANPGFHKAIAEGVHLSVITPKHLKKIELLKDYKETKEADLNSLMDLAIDKVVSLPLFTVDDEWRSNVFHGKIKSGNWKNHRYLKQRRSDDADDAKFSIPHQSRNIAFFVSQILQFQIFKGLCIAAGQYDPATKKVPLHQCDFYESTEAGKKLGAGLALGSSENWHVVLEQITGEKDMKGSALLEYFEPLNKYVEEENAKNVGSMGRTIMFVFVMEMVVLFCHS